MQDSEFLTHSLAKQKVLLEVRKRSQWQYLSPFHSLLLLCDEDENKLWVNTSITVCHILAHKQKPLWIWEGFGESCCSTRISELHRHWKPHSTPSSATENETDLLYFVKTRQESLSHPALLTKGLKNSSPGTSDTANTLELAMTNRLQPEENQPYALHIQGIPLSHRLKEPTKTTGKGVKNR